MGFLDKLKGAVNAVTGGGAKVTLDYSPTFVYPGDRVTVTISATSTGAEVKCGGVYVDLQGSEEVRVKSTGPNHPSTSTQVSTTLEKSFQIAPEFVLGANETKNFEGTFELPPGLHPSYNGPQARHEWRIRGRLEAWGNDPDSGFKGLRVGYRE